MSPTHPQSLVAPVTRKCCQQPSAMLTRKAVVPRTLALDRCDGVGVPEIISMVPPLPIRDWLRRMRGASHGELAGQRFVSVACCRSGCLTTCLLRCSRFVPFAGGRLMRMRAASCVGLCCLYYFGSLSTGGVARYALLMCCGRNTLDWLRDARLSAGGRFCMS